MIKKISIRNYKSIKNLDVECKKFNLITGTNSSGKSSFLQTILLPCQFKCGSDPFNGKYIELGNHNDLLCYHADEKKMNVNIVLDKEEIDYSYENIEIESYGIIPNVKFDEFDVKYLSCNRIGAQSIYKKNHELNRRDIGANGEFAIYYLEEYKDISIDDDLTYDKSSTTLFAQVNYWLNNITKAKIDTYDVNSDYVGCRYNINGKYCNPINVGAGHSYVVSIIIMCLLSNKNDILIIEDPEIHLHPNAQSKLCEFLYFVSQSGRQLFVETHSDHFFNGIRAGISTKKMEKEIVCCDYFYFDDDKCTKNVVVDIGDNGKILNMVDGLFDQFDIDLDRMLGL